MLGLSKLMLTQIIIFQFTLWKGVNKEFVHYLNLWQNLFQFPKICTAKCLLHVEEIFYLTFQKHFSI